MMISEYFKNRRKGFLKLLIEKQPEGISAIQEFVQKHIDKGLFVNGSGIEVFDYMNENLAICFYHDGTGECQDIYKENYIPIDKYTGEPLVEVKKFNPYELDDYSSKKFDSATEQHRIWRLNHYWTWAINCWQKSLVNTKVPFAFFSDYYQSFYFDLMAMEHGEYDEWSNQPTKITLLHEELLLRISGSILNHVFLKKENVLLEIGVLRQPKLNFTFERRFEKDKWIVIKKIAGKINGKNDLRNVAGRLVRIAIEEGFECINLPTPVSYTPLLNFILPDNLFGSKNHWGEKNNISIDDFETQLNIDLPKDYRAFLETYNGFQTHPYYGFGYTKYDSVRPILFYGLTEKTEFDIVSQIEKMKFECLPDFIPIGEDQSKNKIWLGVSKGKKGQVVYKRFEATQKKIVTYHLDTSFQSFIDDFHFASNEGIQHILEANDLEYFKKYINEQWSWDDALAWNRTAIDVILWREKPRPQFLDYAFSEGIRVNRLHRYGYHLVPEIIEIFDKHNIAIPKVCYSRRLQSILESGKPVDENEFNELVGRCADINVFQVYEKLQKWRLKNDRPHLQELVKKLKPYYKELSDSERIKLIVDQKGIVFSNKEKTVNYFEVKNMPSDVNFKYPEVLIEFLKKYQDTTPSLSFFEFTISAGNDHHFAEIDHFFNALEVEKKYLKIKTVLDKLGIIEYHLPFANTKSGGYLVINCQKGSNDFGKIGIVYNHIIRWDRHKEHQDYKLKKSISVDLPGFLLSLLPQNYVFDEMSLQAKNGNIDYFKMRLEKGWNINAYTQTEQICLHQAIRNNHYELAKFLLTNGANANLKVASPDWDSSLAIAMKYADEKMVQLIYKNSDLEYTKDYNDLKLYLIQYYGKKYLDKF